VIADGAEFMGRQERRQPPQCVFDLRSTRHDASVDLAMPAINYSEKIPAYRSPSVQ
jgi:hypothetical protein